MPSNLPIDGHSFRRVEILTGTPRRRRWSAAEKMAVVAESLAPGAVTSTIALRHGLHRNQLYAWRREFRSAAFAEAGVPVPDFVPVITEHRADAGAAAIEIEIGGAIVRAGPGIEIAFLGKVIRLLKASSSTSSARVRRGGVLRILPAHASRAAPADAKAAA